MKFNISRSFTIKLKPEDFLSSCENAVNNRFANEFIAPFGGRFHFCVNSRPSNSFELAPTIGRYIWFSGTIKKTEGDRSIIIVKGSPPLWLHFIFYLGGTYLAFMAALTNGLDSGDLVVIFLVVFLFFIVLFANIYIAAKLLRKFEKIITLLDSQILE
ncbi:MAG: hypothetical protein JW749_00715 [Sedimentisphaerales bacterium]|nr:hypothetical protein [Sedimentisphaerales bacterium]